MLVLQVSAMNASATPIFIQSGTWIVDSELNGLPGRGMAIDVQNQHLVMQVYNYTSTGQPTFHLASGPLNQLQFQAPLKQYRGGRFFGSGERIAREDNSAGDVRIRFESSTSGFVQFPGEPEVAMSRFKFGGIPEGAWLKPNFRESWMAIELNENDEPLSPWKIEIYKDPANGGKESLVVINGAWYETSRNASNVCSAMGGNGWLRCEVAFEVTDPTRKNAVFEIRKTVNGLEGFITRQASPQKRTKLRGSKFSSYDTVTATAFRMAGFWDPRIIDYGSRINESGTFVFAPEPGTWIVSSELNGKPGRGMAIDVQNDELVMQLYGYESNGDPTFHLAVGTLKFPTSHAPGQEMPHITARLKRYAGGRYFGGPSLSGREVADAGKVEIIFKSPLKGKVRFPGEDWLAIEKFQFGYSERNLEALLGQWAFGGMGSWDYVITLDKVEGEYAKGKYASCQYSDPMYGNGYVFYNGSVFCTLYMESGSTAITHVVTFDASPEIRAVPAIFGRLYSSGAPMPLKGFAIQVRDKNGTPPGWDHIRNFKETVVD